MNDLLESNLSFLARHFPSLEVGREPQGAAASRESTARVALTRSPAPNITFRGRPFHSAADPVREAETLVGGLAVREGYLFVFMGLGMGYQIEAFKRLYPSWRAATLVAIERSGEAFDLLLGARDVSFLEGLHLFVGGEGERVEAFFEGLGSLSLRGYRVVSLRGARGAFPAYYGALEAHLKRTLAEKLSDVLTRFAFECLWMKNIIANVPYAVGRPSIRAWKGALKGEPALVLGAGPSLCAQLPLVRELGGRVRVVAVDTVLDTLSASGCSADFVVTLDAQFQSLHDFALTYSPPRVPGEGRASAGREHRGDAPGVPEADGPCLVADLVAYPGILKRWRGPLAFSGTSMEAVPGSAEEPSRGERASGRPSGAARGLHPLLEALERHHGPIDPLPCGGSVATTAIEFALYAGADPVVTAGLDLAYTGFMTHASSSAPYRILDSRSNRLRTLLTSMAASIGRRHPFAVPGLDGGAELTDFVFTSYRNWLGAREGYGGRVLNATGSGVPILGMGRADLADLASSLARKGRLKTGLRPDSSAGPLTARAAAAFLKNLKGDLDAAAGALGRCRGRSMEETRAAVGGVRFLENALAEAERLYSGGEHARGERAGGGAVAAHLAALASALSRAAEKALLKVERS